MLGNDNAAIGRPPPVAAAVAAVLDDLDRLKAEMAEEDYSRKTVNNTLATLSKILHYAHDLEMIPKMPRFKFLGPVNRRGSGGP